MRLLGKFGTVGGATMVSRILGFVREAMIAAALGPDQSLMSSTPRSAFPISFVDSSPRARSI